MFLLLLAQFLLEIWDNFILKIFIRVKHFYATLFIIIYFFLFFIFSLHTTLFDVPCRQTTIFLKPLFIASNLIYDTCVLFSSYFFLFSLVLFLLLLIAHIQYIYTKIFVYFFSVQDQNLTNKLLNWLTYDNLSCAFFFNNFIQSRCVYLQYFCVILATKNNKKWERITQNCINIVCTFVWCIKCNKKIRYRYE